jgi:hypothetical protein
MAGGETRRFDWKSFLLLCAIYLGLAFLWNTVWAKPLKLFVVFLHEASHGLAALATGGSIREVKVFAEEGGLAETYGGHTFVVLSAGYLGSMLFGVALLLVATRTKLSQWVALLVGVGTVTLAIRAMPTEGRMFAIVCGVVLGGLAPLPRFVSEFVLRVVAVASCLYAILDIKSDVIDRRGPSDATELARHTGVPAVAWGALWIAIALVVMYQAARWAVTSAPSPPKVRSADR